MTELPPHARRVDSIGPGTRLREWEVVRFVGSGAFGRVFEARRPSWVSGDDNRALKVFDPILSSAARSNLVTEFATMREVRHPHLVAGYDAFDLDDGPFAGCVVFVIEMCDGDLASAIPHAAGGVPPADAAEVLADVSEGLAALHAHGRIHGDVKPENILRKGATWKIGDFGVSGAIQGSYAMAAGITVDYRPPEFSQVDEGVRLHKSADIWAVGVTLHVACTGRHPFPGPDPFMRYAASLRGERQEVPGLDPRIREVIDRRCMHPDPRQRASAAELAAELRAVAQQIRGEPSAPSPAPPSAPPPDASPAPDASNPAGALPVHGVPPGSSTPPGNAPPAWADPTVRVVAPTEVSPYPTGRWPDPDPAAPAVPPPGAAPAGPWAAAPFGAAPPPSGHQPFPAAPGPLPAPPPAARLVGWEAVPITAAVTLLVAWIVSLVVSVIPTDGDPPTLRRVAYLVLCGATLGAVGVLSRRRVRTEAPWGRIAAAGGLIAFAAFTYLLFFG